jgi:hypothetical protein
MRGVRRDERVRADGVEPENENLVCARDKYSGRRKDEIYDKPFPWCEDVPMRVRHFPAFALDGFLGWAV